MARTPSREVEDGLLSAAEQILMEQGPGALTVREVAAAAGVAPMGVYSRFSGKQGLLEALFVRGFDMLAETIAAASGRDASQRLRDAALRYRTFAVTHPQHYRLMFEMMHEVDPSGESLGRAFASFDQLTQLVVDARGLGPLGVGTDMEVAQQWWSAVHGAVSLELLGIRFDTDPAQTFERLVDALLAGMRSTGEDCG